MSKFSRNLVIAFAVCSATAVLYLPSLLAQDATKKASSTSVNSGTASLVPAKVTKAAEGTRSMPPTSAAASGTSTKTKKTADSTLSVPATKNTATKNAIANDSGTEKSKPASSKLRLPRYFTGIVDEDQREQCLAIQLEYRQKVAELEEELSRVRQDEMTALEKVLTDSQRKLLEKKRSEGKPKASTELKTTESESDESGM